jgi:hypothetical protein
MLTLLYQNNSYIRYKTTKELEFFFEQMPLRECGALLPIVLCARFSCRGNADCRAFSAVCIGKSETRIDPGSARLFTLNPAVLVIERGLAED